MRIASGTTDQYIYFYAVDATNFTTPETGLSTWTVYRSRNGGAAAAFTTPTINETDSVNMAGVYELLLDEDMTIDAGDDEQEMVFHISHAGMAPVVRTITLFRPKITAGNTLDVATTGEAGLDFDNIKSTSLVTLHSLTVTGATTFTGAVLVSGGTTLTHTNGDALTLTAVGSGADGLQITGDGLGAGVNISSGTGIGAIGLKIASLAANGSGVQLTGTGTRHGISILGGASGQDISAVTRGNALGTTTMDITGTVSGNSTHAAADVWSVAARVLTANTNLNDPTAAAIADAVWDEAVAGHVGAGTFGATDAAILADTNELQTDDIPATLATIAGYLDTEIAAILEDTGTTLPATLAGLATAAELAKVPKSDSTVSWNATALAAINAECDTALSDYDAPTNTEMTAAFTEIKGATWSSITDTLEAIRDRGDAAWITATGFMPSTEDGSSFTAIPDMATATNQTTIASYIDTEVGAIVTALATAQADLDILTGTDGVTLATAQANYAPATATQVATALTTALTTTTMAEDYPADGAAATPAELLYLILACVSQFDISGTVLTIRKLDGTTSAGTYTLDDDTSPTSRVRAT